MPNPAHTTPIESPREAAANVKVHRDPDPRMAEIQAQSASQQSDATAAADGDAAATSNTQCAPTPQAPRRPARSKHGCLTCRRRKVRCSEQRPRCSSCERLNLECKWPSPNSSRVPSRARTAAKGLITPGANGNPVQTQIPQPGTDVVNGFAPGHALAPSGFSPPGEHSELPRDRDPGRQGLLTPQYFPDLGAVDQLFDYASFMWHPGDALNQITPPRQDGSSGNENGIDNWFSGMSNTGGGPHLTHPQSTASVWGNDPQQHQLNQAQPMSWSPSSASYHHSTGDRRLMDYFVGIAVPPILAEVETQKRWSSIRQLFISMSNNSTMVRYATLAFSSLLLHRRDTRFPLRGPQHHYESAVAELLASAGDTGSITAHTTLREHLLATLFFLSYVDILEDRVDNAHAHLKRAYQIFQQGDKRGFRPIEIRLLSWLRMLDARAVSAGGEGLFLSDSSEALLLLVQQSPGGIEETHAPETGFDGSADDTPGSSGGGATVAEDEPADIEDVLCQVLYNPGIIFFQKVQSFMGRISMIDPWHRSRGTVEDETEVINIAAKILSDLRKLYDDRPPLMDHAIAGRLTAPHLSAPLALSITQAFRTYLSNYYASKVHLHRVAYKHLPLTYETTKALQLIRELTRRMVEGLDADSVLPVSQLWPLLMLGSEENDPVERVWIKEQILRMEAVATNARITAQVLEEVQTRQDASKTRVDIRSIMHAIFDSCFAIM